MHGVGETVCVEIAQADDCNEVYCNIVVARDVGRFSRLVTEPSSKYRSMLAMSGLLLRNGKDGNFTHSKGRIAGSRFEFTFWKI